MVALVSSLSVYKKSFSDQQSTQLKFNDFEPNGTAMPKTEL